MSIKIEGKVALVTGANRGIGKEIVHALIKNGAKKVYLAVRSVESASALEEQYGELVQALPADLAKPETIAALANTASDVNIVVNNAGVLEVADPFAENAETLFAHEFDVNVLGLIRIAKALIPVIESNGPGAFVQLNSVASIKNFMPFTTYSASKAAAYSVTQGIRDSLFAKQVQVVSVHPGPISTDMADKAGMSGMGEPPAIVADAIMAGLEAGDYHVFPDTMAKQFEQAYQGYSSALIEPAPETAEA